MSCGQERYYHAVAHRLGTGNIASKQAPNKAIGVEHALRRKLTSAKKRFTCANSAGSLGKKIRRRRQQRPSRCTIDFKLPLSLRSRRAQMCSTSTATCVIDKQAEAGLHGRPCRSWRKLNHNASPQRWQKQQAAALPDFFPLLDVAAEVVNACQRLRSTMKELKA